MPRDKNPKIPHDRKERYNRTVRLRDEDCIVRIEYDACLIDSEDIDLISVDGCTEAATLAYIQGLLDCVGETLRAELAEYADYVESHRFT